MLGIILIIVVLALLPRRRYWDHPHGMFFGGCHGPHRHPGPPHHGCHGHGGHRGGPGRGCRRF